jgi:hypothetical protein
MNHHYAFIRLIDAHIFMRTLVIVACVSCLSILSIVASLVDFGARGLEYRLLEESGQSDRL